MEEIESNDIDRMYLVHWNCPKCEVSNTDEKEDKNEGTEEAQCWECQTKVKLSWQY